MRPRTLFLLAFALAAVPAARAQFGFPGGGVPGGFQSGITPRGASIDLAPGQSYRLALYCADLFADRPTDRVTFTVPGTEAAVTLASGQTGTLGEAIAAGLVHVRGRGRIDGPRRERGRWFDAFLTNAARQPLHVSLPMGTLLVPAGQPVPDVRPSVRRLFAAAQERRLLGSDTLAHAVWATRGFTREDVEQTTLSPLPDAEAQRVQTLLAAANLGHQFDRGAGSYAKLYEQRRAGLAGSTSVNGSAVLPDGRKVQADVVADAAGSALVKLSPARGGALYYAGQVASRRPERLVLTLLHLKTGRPLEAAGESIVVKLPSG